MNTYFYTKLLAGGYASVRNWTKNVDIFDTHILLIPIHLDLHWALVVVDFRYLKEGVIEQMFVDFMYVYCITWGVSTKFVCCSGENIGC